MESKLIFVFTTCLVIAAISITTTSVLIYKHIKAGTSYGGLSLLSVPISLMGILLVLYTIGKEIDLFDLSVYPYMIIICLTWLLLELCIFIYSVMTKEETFLHMILLVILFLAAMLPLENNIQYKLFFYICLFVGILFPILDLFHCKLTK